MKNRYCDETLIYELVEFGVTPPADCRAVDGIGYDRIREGWTAKLQKTLFNVGDESERRHNDIMHDSYLPHVDPQHNYVSVIHDVPVPWVTRPEDGKDSMGLNFRVETATDNDGERRDVAKVVTVKPESRAKILTSIFVDAPIAYRKKICLYVERKFLVMTV